MLQGAWTKVVGLSGALVVALGLAGGPAKAAAVASVEASGSGMHWWRVCSTCPDEVIRVSDHQGGPGAVSAAASGAEDGFAFAASARFVGATALPELKAIAETSTPHSPAIYTTASAAAQAVQAYVYLGSAATDYTIDFTIDGTLRGDGESIEGGLTVFGADYTPGGEGPGGAGTRLGGDRVRVSLNEPPGVVVELIFDEARSVSFHVEPGDTFYVSAFLTAGSFFGGLGTPSAPGVADAFHTFRSTFTAGDTSLLQVPGLAVSEPPIWTLAALALMVLPLRRRHRSDRSAVA